MLKDNIILTVIQFGLYNLLRGKVLMSIRIKLFFTILGIFCLLSGCAENSPQTPPASADGVLSVTVQSNWGGVCELSIYDSLGNSVKEQTLSFNEAYDFSLAEGDYKVSVSYLGKEQSTEALISSGKTTKLNSFYFEQHRDIELNITLSESNISGKVEAVVNGVSTEFNVGENVRINVLRSSSYDINVNFTYNDKTYNKQVIVEDSAINGPINIEIEIEKEFPYLNLSLTSDDALIDGKVVSVFIGDNTYEMRVNESIVIADLEEGVYEVSVSFENDGFSYLAKDTVILKSGSTTSLDLIISTDKSEGEIVIDDDIVGNIEIEIEGTKDKYEKGDALILSALYQQYEGLNPVWLLRTLDGEYSEIGEGNNLSYTLDLESGSYIVAFVLLTDNAEVAARQTVLINVI